MAIDEPKTPRRLMGVLNAMTHDDDETPRIVLPTVRDRVDAAQGEGHLVASSSTAR